MDLWSKSINAFDRKFEWGREYNKWTMAPKEYPPPGLQSLHRLAHSIHLSTFVLPTKTQKESDKLIQSLPLVHVYHWFFFDTLHRQQPRLFPMRLSVFYSETKGTKVHLCELHFYLYRIFIASFYWHSHMSLSLSLSLSLYLSLSLSSGRIFDFPWAEIWMATGGVVSCCFDSFLANCQTGRASHRQWSALIENKTDSYCVGFKIQNTL